jgi:hypothetical protein
MFGGGSWILDRAGGEVHVTGVCEALTMGSGLDDLHGALPALSVYQPGTVWSLSLSEMSYPGL